MAIARQLGQYATVNMSRRLMRSMPVIGGALALLTLGVAIRRKGWFGGSLDTALEFLPFIGAAKNVVEVGRGRDLIRDKPAVAR